MKKKITALVGVMCMLCVGLSACGSKDVKETKAVNETKVVNETKKTEETKEAAMDLKQELVGSRWELIEVYPDEVNAMLEGYLFDPEEIAYANAEDFAFYRVFDFNEDGTVTLAYDTEKIREHMYNALDHFMNTLYENKENLVEVYGQDMVDQCDSEGKFKNTMASMIGEMDSSEELLNRFADNVVSYYFDVNQYTSNSGTYTIEESQVYVELDQDQSDLLTYDAENDQLVDSAEQIYSRIDK